MGDRLLEVVKQVGIFMICAQMILHFRPSESYNKYIKLLVSIMVLVQLTVPVMGIFGGKNMDEFLGKVSFYDSLISESMQEADITATNAETLLNEITMEEVKTRLNNQEQDAEQDGQEMQDGKNEEIVVQIDRIEVTADE